MSRYKQLICKLLYFTSDYTEDVYREAVIDSVAGALPPLGDNVTPQALLQAICDEMNGSGEYSSWLRCLILQETDFSMTRPVYVARYALPMSNHIVPLITTGLLPVSTYGEMTLKDFLTALYGSFEKACTIVLHDRSIQQLVDFLPDAIKSKIATPEEYAIALEYNNITASEGIRIDVPKEWREVIKATPYVYTSEINLPRALARMCNVYGVPVDLNIAVSMSELVSRAPKRLEPILTLVTQENPGQEGVQELEDKCKDKPVPDDIRVILEALYDSLPESIKSESVRSCLSSTHFISESSWLVNEKQYSSFCQAIFLMYKLPGGALSTIDADMRIKSQFKCIYDVIKREDASRDLAVMTYLKSIVECMRTHKYGKIYFMRHPLKYDSSNFEHYFNTNTFRDVGWHGICFTEYSYDHYVSDIDRAFVLANSLPGFSIVTGFLKFPIWLPEPTFQYDNMEDLIFDIRRI